VKKLVIVLAGIFGAFLASGLTFQQITELDINLGILLALFGGFLYALYLFLKKRKSMPMRLYRYYLTLFCSPLHSP